MRPQIISAARSVLDCHRKVRNRSLSRRITLPWGRSADGSQERLRLQGVPVGSWAHSDTWHMAPPLGPQRCSTPSILARCRRLRSMRTHRRKEFPPPPPRLSIAHSPLPLWEQRCTVARERHCPAQGACIPLQLRRRFWPPSEMRPYFGLDIL